MTSYRRTVALLSTAALLALAALGFAGTTAGATTPALNVYSGSSNGKTVKLAKGDVLFVDLRAASGTPYVWKVVKGKHTTKFRIVKRQTASVNPGVPGAPYRTTWTIKGTKVGTATFRVVLRSAVDGDVARRFTLHVKVTR